MSFPAEFKKKKSSNKKKIVIIVSVFLILFFFVIPLLVSSFTEQDEQDKETSIDQIPQVVTEQDREATIDQIPQVVTEQGKETSIDDHSWYYEDGQEPIKESKNEKLETDKIDLQSGKAFISESKDFAKTLLESCLKINSETRYNTHIQWMRDNKVNEKTTEIINYLYDIQERKIELDRITNQSLDVFYEYYDCLFDVEEKYDANYIHDEDIKESKNEKLETDKIDLQSGKAFISESKDFAKTLLEHCVSVDSEVDYYGFAIWIEDNQVFELTREVFTSLELLVMEYPELEKQATQALYMYDEYHSCLSEVREIYVG